MKLQDITASKLYKTSSRRKQLFVKASSAVRSSHALNIQQDWQVSKPEEFQDVPANNIKVSSEQTGSHENTATVTRSEHDDAAVSHTAKSHAMQQEDTYSSAESDETVAKSNNKDEAANSDNAEDKSDASSSTKVTASAGTSLPRIDVTDDMGNEVRDIKGLLNSQESTAGVNRVSVKDNEVWVYYNDYVNLNDIMVDAIELVTNAAFTYLEFNRLARSDNAIVFVIIKDDTARKVAYKSEGAASKEE